MSIRPAKESIMKGRGRRHTTLTETATLVVNELKKIEGIKMIAPGIIDPKRRAATRYLTAVYTNAGLELIVAGNGVQKVAVHTETDPKEIFAQLKEAKKLQFFSFNERERKPGSTS